MQRSAVLLGVATLICSCNAPDASLGTGSREIIDFDKLNQASQLVRFDLGTLGGASSFASDINNSGVVVGWSQTAGGATHAFRWTEKGGMVDLGTLPGHSQSRALAVLDGRAFGDANVLGISDGVPVVWSASGTISALPIPLLPGATCTAAANDLNTQGHVVGMDCIGFGHGWFWSSAAGKYDLTLNSPGGSPEGEATAVSPSGAVVVRNRLLGTCAFPFSSTCWRTYLWSVATGYMPLGTPNNERDADVSGLAINEEGTVVGSYRTRTAGGAYRWNADNGFTQLPRYAPGNFLPGSAYSVNGSGSAAGTEWEPVLERFVATAWPASGGILRLSPTDANPGVAMGINDRGTIAGWATQTDGSTHAVIWTTANNSPSVNRVPVDGPLAAGDGAGSRCLTNPDAITSRQTLFACVTGPK